MRSYILRAGSSSLDDLVMVERDEPRPGTREVLIQVRACSLNFRDQAVLTGNYFGGKVPHDQVPLSDGAARSSKVGIGVTKFKPGDRVQSTFFLKWSNGTAAARRRPGHRGAGRARAAQRICRAARGSGGADGVELELRGGGDPACAGVTAWNGLVHGAAPLRPGQDVLLLGTGGVSILRCRSPRPPAPTSSSPPRPTRSSSGRRRSAPRSASTIATPRNGAPRRRAPSAGPASKR
jgi:NADPH:quinone reductase-like Zn-dependent oxidoreductase